MGLAIAQAVADAGNEDGAVFATDRISFVGEGGDNGSQFLGGNEVDVFADGGVQDRKLHGKDGLGFLQSQAIF